MVDEPESDFKADVWLNDRWNELTKPGKDSFIDTPFNLPEDGDLSSPYNFNQRWFPIDLGSPGSWNQHWIMININVPNRSAWTQGQATYNGADYSLPSTADRNELSKVDALRANIDQRFTQSIGGGTAGGDPSDLGRTLGPGRGFVPRQTRRIVESIALFMPNTAYFTQQNEYTDVSLTDIVKNAAESIPVLGTGVRLAEAGAQLAQAPYNPRVEVLFSATPQRQFQFDFLFAPTNEDETRHLNEIIKTIRFHAAPEVNAFEASWGDINFGDIGSIANGVLDTLKGLVWTPPSEFDISFMYGTQENFNLPRINTCALESVDIDYAPTGVYSTFSNGAPVRTRMMLKFRELEILHKLRVLQGF